MKCKYCGKELHKSHSSVCMCTNCFNKYPTVKRLCAICKKIKEYKNESTN